VYNFTQASPQLKLTQSHIDAPLAELHGIPSCRDIQLQLPVCGYILLHRLCTAPEQMPSHIFNSSLELVVQQQLTVSDTLLPTFTLSLSLSWSSPAVIKDNNPLPNHLTWNKPNVEPEQIEGPAWQGFKYIGDFRKPLFKLEYSHESCKSWNIAFWLHQ
jgi:hypothetical protein